MNILQTVPLQILVVFLSPFNCFTKLGKHSSAASFPSFELSNEIQVILKDIKFSLISWWAWGTCNENTSKLKNVKIHVKDAYRIIGDF